MNKEFHNLVSREGWMPGPWDLETLDRKFWVDPETNYLCLIYRQSMGHWCGYVAISTEHPYFGYDTEEMDVQVHGGITYGNTNPAFILNALLQEPIAIELMAQKEKGPLMDWLIDQGIPGPALDAFWLGFDCAHAGDLSPAFSGLKSRFIMEESFDIYRDAQYVQEECRNLALQLYQIEKENSNETD